MSAPTTLMAYAEQLYPGCSTDVWRGEDPPFVEHTVVMQVVGQRATESAITVMEHQVGEERVAAVLVHTRPPRVQQHRLGRDEIGGIAIGAAVGAGLGLVGTLLTLPSFWAGFAIVMLAAAFGAGVAAVVAMRDSVSSLHAVPTMTTEVGLVAALMDDGATAERLAATLEEEGLYDVHVVHSA